jgi:rhamnulokinase
VAVATHDTASAVAAITSGEGSAPISPAAPGRCSGLKSPPPAIDDRALRLNFTNEGGVEKTYRLLKNIMGLWILQEIKREWRAGPAPILEELTALASRAIRWFPSSIPTTPVPCPRSDAAADPENCRETGQIVPESEQDLLRVVLESLAMKYSWTLDRLDELTGPKSKRFKWSGGIRNELLCQLTANAIARPVMAGPTERLPWQYRGATHRLGTFKSIAEARTAIRNSFPMKEYHPLSIAAWEKRLRAILSLMKR